MTAPPTTSAISCRPAWAKRKPSPPRRAGQIAAIPGHLATMSFKNNKKVFWDEKTQKYHFS